MPRPRALSGPEGVEGEVELDDVHAGLAEVAEVALLDVRLDHAAHVGLGEPARRSDARNLEQGVRAGLM
jgi:hypothetical protein